MKYLLYANILKALAHPTRIEILDLLKNHDRLCVCDIYSQLDLEQSNVSQHLKILKEQGILWSQKEGLMVFYNVRYLEIYDVLESIKKMLKMQIEDTRIEL